MMFRRVQAACTTPSERPFSLVWEGAGFLKIDDPGRILRTLPTVVVLENSNMEKLASNKYLLVQSRSKEDRYDINDASPREIYAIFVPESTMRTLQSSRRRQHRASVVDWDAQAHRTAALYGMRPGVLGTGRHPDGSQQAPRRHGHTAAEMSAVGCL